MAASAGTLYAIGNTSKRTYSVDVYVPDATGTQLTFNPSGLAASTSPATWRPPEDVVIYDVSIHAAPAAVGAFFTLNGATLNGGTIRWTNQLDTLPNRGKLNLTIPAGGFLGATQF